MGASYRGDKPRAYEDLMPVGAPLPPGRPVGDYGCVISRGRAPRLRRFDARGAPFMGASSRWDEPRTYEELMPVGAPFMGASYRDDEPRAYLDRGIANSGPRTAEQRIATADR